MVEKLLNFYNKESMYNNYIKKFSLLILFLLIFVLSIIVFFNIIFWIKQLSIATLLARGIMNIVDDKPVSDLFTYTKEEL